MATSKQEFAELQVWETEFKRPKITITNMTLLVKNNNSE